MSERRSAKMALKIMQAEVPFWMPGAEALDYGGGTILVKLKDGGGICAREFAVEFIINSMEAVVIPQLEELGELVQQCRTTDRTMLAIQAEVNRLGYRAHWFRVDELFEVDCGSLRQSFMINKLLWERKLLSLEIIRFASDFSKLKTPRSHDWRPPHSIPEDYYSG